MVDRGPVRIVAINGSVRPGNYTGKALAVVMDELGTIEEVSSHRLDLDSLRLPLPGQGGGAEESSKLQDLIRPATGVILATPEYHGSYSSAMKICIENLGFPSILSSKPVALLGVAAGAIGAIKALEHLRSVCSHIGAIVLPGPVSVAGVNKVFDEDGRCTDPRTEKRIRGLARSLRDYIDQNVCPRVALERMVREEQAAS